MAQHVQFYILLDEGVDKGYKYQGAVSGVLYS